MQAVERTEEPYATQGERSGIPPLSGLRLWTPARGGGLIWSTPFKGWS